MKRRNCFGILVLVLLLVSVLGACSKTQEEDATVLDIHADKESEIVESKETKEPEENLDTPKSCIGKWYAEFSYSDENSDESEVYLYATVREDGTYDLRWVEPADPEDVTETYEYELVKSEEEITEEFLHIYYDEEKDQLVMDADGLVVTLDREKEFVEHNSIPSEEQAVLEDEDNTDIQDNIDWRDAYISFLSGLSDDFDLTGDFFYVDEDDIPEIIIKNSMGPAIYKYYQGNVVEVMKNEADGLGAVFLCEKDSVYVEYFGDETVSIYNFYKMNEDGSTEPIVYTCNDKEYDLSADAWYIDQIPVNKDEYYAKLEEMKNTYGNLRGGFEYNKSISQLIDILKSGDDISEGPTEIRELSSGQTANASEEDNAAAHKAYELELTSAKNDLYYDGDPNEDYIEYAYADIDNDFIDELIVLVNKSYAAGCVSYIYDYNLVTGNTFLIFEGERDITIYNNGVIAAFSPDNHSLGLLWPYSLYCMGEYGEYEYETYVYSWDMEYGEYDNGISFPYDVDVDGNGIVYHLYDSYMDDSEYETWENNILLKENRIQLMFNTY